nr:unnamed protein product [Callosobruchus analis]
MDLNFRQLANRRGSGSSSSNFVLDKEEINNIILGSEPVSSKKTTKTTEINSDTKTPSRADKVNRHEHNVQGDATKSDRSYNVGLDDMNSIFSSKMSISRTPPEVSHKVRCTKKTKELEDTIADVGKRPRSLSSPEFEHINKRQCYEQEGIITERVIMNFFHEIETIKKHTEKDLNQFPFNEQDKANVLNATMNMHKLMTQLILKVSIIEKENIKLASKLENTLKTESNLEVILGLIKGKEEQQANNQTGAREPQIKSYANTVAAKAEVSHVRPSKQLEEPREQSQGSWRTPPDNRKYETLIRIDKTEDAKLVVNRLKQELKQKDTEGGFKNIRQLQSGAVIVESHNETQQEKLRALLNNKRDITVKGFERINPMFMITGIEKGYESEDFVRELIRLNSEIVEELNCNVVEKIKVVARKNCRNPLKENWILQAPPEISKWFLKRGFVNFDLLKVYVQEHINLAICFRCASFGHIAKFCKQPVCCYKCSGNHEAQQCQEENLKCINCKKMKYDDHNHSTRSSLTTRQCSFLHQNVQSLGNAVLQLNEVFNEQGDIKVLCITEHWKSKSQLAAYGIENFRLVGSFCRSENRHGGCAVYVVNQVVCKERREAEDLSVEGHSCIDNFLTNAEFSRAEVLHTIISDHTAQKLIIEFKDKITRDCCYRRIFSESNEVMFLNNLNNIIWSDIYEVNANDVNAQWEKFSSIFHSVYDRNFPLKKVWNSDRKKRYHDKDTEVIRCKKELDILYTASLVNSSYKDQYKQKRKEYNMTLVNCQKREYNRKILQSDNKNKTVWQIVKEINGKVNHQLHLETDLELRTTADKYNKFLVESVEGLSRLQNLIYNCEIDSNSNSMYVEPVDSHEIFDIVKCLKNKRSSGEDEVSSIIIKKLRFGILFFGNCSDFEDIFAYPGMAPQPTPQGGGYPGPGGGWGMPSGYQPQQQWGGQGGGGDAPGSQQQPSSVQVNPGTGQPDYSMQWAEYYRSMGLHREAEMIEQQAKAKAAGGGSATNGAVGAASAGPAAGAAGPGATSAAAGGGQADYSAQWAEYYRTMGKIKEAEAIEAQMKNKGGAQPSGGTAPPGTTGAAGAGAGGNYQQAQAFGGYQGAAAGGYYGAQGQGAPGSVPQAGYFPGYNYGGQQGGSSANSQDN